MQILTVRVQPGYNDELIDFLCQQMSFDYRRRTNNVVILAGEEYRFRTNSNQFRFIVISEQQDYLEIDIVGGGGGSGIFRISWGSEASFVHNANYLIKQFCATFGLTHNEIK